MFSPDIDPVKSINDYWIYKVVIKIGNLIISDIICLFNEISLL